MTENMKAFIKAVNEDDELMGSTSALVSELVGADDATRSEVVARMIALATDKGFALTEEDLMAETPSEGEIEEEELVAISGGGGCSLPQQIFNQCSLIHIKSYSM